MSVELNHTIIWAHDKAKSAAFLAGILDLPVGEQWGPFVPVQVSNGVTLDYADAADIQSQHYAFLLNEDEFDAAFTRLQESGLTYYADPFHRHSGEINHNYGGRTPSPGRSCTSVGSRCSSRRWTRATSS